MQAGADRSALLSIALCAGLLWSCGSARDPVRELSRDLARYPEYSIIVDDLRMENGFFPKYHLRLKYVTTAGARVGGRDTVLIEEQTTDWLPADEHVFRRYEHHVGMVVASRDREGRHTGVEQAHPPGYGYVGNPNYGFWGAGGFWQFYGQYALMRDLMGGWRVSREDYGDYRRTRERGQPYYGPVRNGRPTFGTRGTVTQKTRPSFYQRYTAKRQAFATRARSRMAQSRSSWGRTSFRGK